MLTQEERRRIREEEEERQQIRRELGGSNTGWKVLCGLLAAALCGTGAFVLWPRPQPAGTVVVPSPPDAGPVASTPPQTQATPAVSVDEACANAVRVVTTLSFDLRHQAWGWHSRADVVMVPFSVVRSAKRGMVARVDQMDGGAKPVAAIRFNESANLAELRVPGLGEPASIAVEEAGEVEDGLAGCDARTVGDRPQLVTFTRESGLPVALEGLPLLLRNRTVAGLLAPVNDRDENVTALARTDTDAPWSIWMAPEEYARATTKSRRVMVEGAHVAAEDSVVAEFEVGPYGGVVVFDAELKPSRLSAVKQFFSPHVYSLAIVDAEDRPIRQIPRIVKKVDGVRDLKASLDSGVYRVRASTDCAPGCMMKINAQLFER